MNGIIGGDVRKYDIVVHFVEPHCIDTMNDEVLCSGQFAV